MLLAVDLGSTVTKAVVWAGDGPKGAGRSTLRTVSSEGGRAEQSPTQWWSSVVEACREALSGAPLPIEGIAFSAARQTFVPVDASLLPTREGILWSDRRAVSEVAELLERCGGKEELHRKTGAHLDASSPAAKILWLERNEPSSLSDAAWLLSPRDLVLARMTGQVVTDPTLARSTGMYDARLEPLIGLVGNRAGLLPPVVASKTVAGELCPAAAEELGLHLGTPVVIGAGDRPCEVLGTDASAEVPMVSWGTTANISIPTASAPEVEDLGVVVSFGALGGFLIEAGLSSAGSFLLWLSALAGMSGEEAVPLLLEKATASAPGANGITALGTLGGARAPLWRDDVRGTFLGLSPEHDLGDMARAVIEAIAFEVRRCALAISSALRTTLSATVLAGGSEMPLWPEVLAAVTGLEGRRRSSGLAAAAGAALIASDALGLGFELDRMDVAKPAEVPDAELVKAYAGFRPASEAALSAVVSFADATEGSSPG